MSNPFSRIWTGWKEIAGYIGDFQARMVLTVFYFTIVLPFGLLASLGMDLLKDRRPPERSNWIAISSVPVDLSNSRLPF